jgi:hypothetical protein
MKGVGSHWVRVARGRFGASHSPPRWLRRLLRLLPPWSLAGPDGSVVPEGRGAGWSQHKEKSPPRRTKTTCLLAHTRSNRGADDHRTYAATARLRIWGPLR